MRRPNAMLMLPILMSISLAGCGGGLPSNPVRPTTTLAQDECVLDHYDDLTYIIPADAKPLDVIRVEQPQCIKAALRQWSVCTE